jgi:hypothetical protein
MNIRLSPIRDGIRVLFEHSGSRINRDIACYIITLQR